MAKQKSGDSDDEAYADAARAERRLLRDEERAANRLEKAKARLAKSEERISRAQERVARRQAAVDVATQELVAAQQARSTGPLSSAEVPAEAMASAGDASTEAQPMPPVEPENDGE
ncbi:MAG: hypothetical protein ACJ789_10505 [Thermomicrobiales bacterium]